MAIDLRELESEIPKLEGFDSSYERYAKLAILYNIYDHNAEDGLLAILQDIAKYFKELKAQPSTSYLQYDMQEQSLSSEPPDAVGEYGDSEFLRAIVGKDSAAVWAIMDELMDTMRTLNIRTYNYTMGKINKLQ